MNKWCLLCGGEYVAGALECADCLVPLSDRRPLSLEELGSEDEEQVAYDFEELTSIQRLHIDELFWTDGIAHSWDGASLVVRDEDERRADALIDQADRDAFLDSEAAQVSYELDDWDDEQRAELSAALSQAAIEHAWDEHGELVVLDEDEARVDALIDAIEDGRGTAAIDGYDEGTEGLTAGGLEAQDVLSELFVASDRLMHDPLDHEGVLSLVDAARMAKALPLPYGFAPAVWEDLLTQVDALARLLNRDDVDDEAVMGGATNLRTMLRQWV